MPKLRKTRSHGSADMQAIENNRAIIQKISGLIRTSGKRIMLGAVLVGIMGTIVFNAVILQPTRHPAPLFAAVDAARSLQDKPKAAADHPLPPVRPVIEPVAAKSSDEKPPMRPERVAVERQPEKYERPAEKIEKLFEKADKPAPKPQPPAATTAKPPAKPASADALGEFIRAGAIPPASIPNEPDAKLMAIQKNLARLGYAVGKPDGMMGSGTRAAIEKFERDRKWPVTGDVSSRLVRELGTVSAGKRD